jgi:hypothetical protein
MQDMLSQHFEEKHLLPIVIGKSVCPSFALTVCETEGKPLKQ